MPRRNAKGRFVKSGTHRRSSSRRSTSRALVVSRPQPVVIRESVSVSRRGGGGGKKRRGGGGGAGHTSLKVKGEIAGWASLLGYLETNKPTTYDQIPTVGGLPKEAIIGGVLHYFGRKHKHLDRAATAALAVAGHKIGAAGFKLSGDDY